MTEVDLSTLFEYQPDGRLVKRSTGRLGDNDTNAAGYRRVCFDRGQLGRFRALAHRLVWIIHNGPILDGALVDHIDGDILNNRIDNLRLVDKSGNGQNSVHRGYWRDKRSGNYYAAIKLNGRQRHLGTFSTEAEARAAHVAAKRIVHQYATPRTLKEKLNG